MNSQEDVRISFQVNKELKENSERLFEHIGLNMSTALNIFLRKAVDESAIPFPLSARHVDFLYDTSVEEISNTFLSTVKNEILEKNQKGFPVAKYDVEKKQAYLETVEEKREYIHE